MLEDLVTRTVQENVYRISAVPSDKLLLERGAGSEDLDKIRNLLNRLGHPVNVNKIIDYAFQPKQDELKPFPVSRFSDGSFGVFYSAIEIPTCKREVEYHIANNIAENESESLTYPRCYHLIRCNYSGNTADLRGRENVHSDLVSSDETGYPFCQELGAKARELKISGLLTPSARRIGGTCVPVFSRLALSKSDLVRVVGLKVEKDGIKFQDS